MQQHLHQHMSQAWEGHDLKEAARLLTQHASTTDAYNTAWLSVSLVTICSLLSATDIEYQVT